MFDLIKYTPLLELWDIFETIITLSAVDSEGYFTLNMADTYIKDLEINVTHSEFWSAMGYFLYRKNSFVTIQRKKKSNKNKGNNKRRK